MSFKIASYKDLLAIHSVGLALNYNRVLGHDVMGRLDPDGFAVMEIAMWHEHAQGKPVDPHYRCKALLKMLDTEEPFDVYIDVPIGMYDALEDSPQAEVG